MWLSATYRVGANKYFQNEIILRPICIWWGVTIPRH